MRSLVTGTFMDCTAITELSYPKLSGVYRLSAPSSPCSLTAIPVQRTVSATCFVTNGFPLLDSWVLRRPSSVADSDPVELKKSVWHSKDVAHIEAEIFRLCKDDCGIPKHHYSAPLRDSYGVPSLTRYSSATWQNTFF